MQRSALGDGVDAALAVIYAAVGLKGQGCPILDEKALWLVGIGHAGYVGGKPPNKD